LVTDILHEAEGDLARKDHPIHVSLEQEARHSLLMEPLVHGGEQYVVVVPPSLELGA